MNPPCRIRDQEILWPRFCNFLRQCNMAARAALHYWCRNNKGHGRMW